MPGFNQTGPLGKGSMTGRGRGRCMPNRQEFGADVPENTSMGRGMGFGYGFRGGVSDNRGRGFGARRMTLPQTETGDVRIEIDRLQQQAESMQQSLEAINQRIMEMERNA